MTQVVIQLEDTLAFELDEASRDEHIRPEALVVDALKRRLAVRWLKKTQRVLGPAARAAGYNSEEDFMNAIS